MDIKLNQTLTEHDLKVAKTAQLELLKVLEDEGMIKCDYKVQLFKTKCYRKTCRLCKLIELLGGE